MLKALHLQGFVSRRVRTAVGYTHVLEAQGDGDLPPVVLLHGFAASGVQMVPLLVRLRRHVRRLLVPDMPGHGFSEVPVTGANRATLEVGLRETLDAMVQEPVVLFGNSMGGLAAIRYALERPEHVRRLVLCSPGGAAMEQSELDEFRSVFMVDSHSEAVQFVDRLLGRRSPLRHVLAVSVRRKLDRPHLGELIGSVTPEDFLLPEQLADLRMPILMVWGRNDEILPRAHRYFFVSHLPEHAHVIEPERMGHSPYLESPRELTRHILGFLRG